MKKIGIILITATIVAGCTERELIVPDAPSNPDGRTLIVPSATVSGMVSAEEASYAAPDWTMPATQGATRAADYPYVTTNAAGKKIIIVSADDKGSSGAALHAPWLQSPAHVETDPANSVSPRFEVAEADALDHANYISDNAGCTAPWRRPTIKEVELIYALKSQLETTFADYCYWSSTSKAGNLASAWYQRYYFNGSHETLYLPKNSDTNNVRCVRDAYPYVTTNASTGNKVIVSQDEYGTSGAALHAPWTATPTHNDLSPENSLSPRFEVDNVTDRPSITWGNATTNYCKAPWRFPTFEELKLMRTFMPKNVNGFKNGYYWAATEKAGDSNQACWVDFGSSNVGYRSKSTEMCLFRCIRDLTLALPPGTGGSDFGSRPFGIMAYAGATEPTNWATPYFDTVVNATATGFELNTPQYFPANGTQKLYFYASAPSHSGSGGSATSEPQAHHYFADGKKDVMWAKDVRGIAKNSDPTKQQQPSFLFQHMLKQVQFKVKADGTFETGKKLTKIAAKNAATGVRIKLISGTVEFHTWADIPLDFTATPITLGTTAVDAGMLMIQPGAAFKVEAVVDGVTYPNIIVTLTGGTNPGAAGTANVVTLTFKRQAVEATATIGAWAASVDGGTIDVN